MPSQVLRKSAEKPEKSSAVWVQIPWLQLFITAETQDYVEAWNEEGIHVNHQQKEKACDAEHLQIIWIIYLK